MSVTSSCTTDECNIIKSTLLSCVEKIRAAEIQSGPDCLNISNLPASNCSNESLSNWLNNLVDTVMSQNIALSKHLKHRFGTRSERAINKSYKQCEKEQKALNKKDGITREEFDKRQTLLQGLRLDLLNELELTSNHALCNSRKLTRLKEQLETVENNISTLKKLPIVDGVDSASSENQNNAYGEAPVITPSSTTSTNSMGSTNSTSSTDSTNSTNSTKNTNDETLSSPVLEKIEKYEKEAIKEKKNCKAKKANSKISRDKIDNHFYGNGLTLSPVVDGYAIDPATGDKIRVYAIAKKLRINKVLHEVIVNISAVKSEVVTVHGKNGECFEINAATYPEIVVRDATGKIVATLDKDLLLKPDSKEKELQKYKLCESYGYGDALRNILTVFKGDLLLSPTEFLSHPRSIYGMRPMFASGSISEQHALKLMIDYLVLKSSKSGLSERNSLLNDGDYYSRQYIIEMISATSRALSPLAMTIRRILFANCKVWHNDETTWKVLENMTESRTKNYLWTLVSGKHERIKGVVYLGAKTRSSDEFLRQFYNKDDPLNRTRLDEIKIETLITDGYPGYKKGLELLESLLPCNRKITHACCHQHLRRYLLEALENMKLDIVFKNICNCSASKYKESVDRELERLNMQVGPHGRRLMFITFLIELILRLDCDFEVADKIALEKRRQDTSRYILERFYQECEILVKESPGLELVSSNGATKVTGNAVYPWAKAIIYAFNNRKELSAFLDNGDIECTNNLAELMVRPAVIHRDNMQFLVKNDTFRSYTDLMTIVLTCKLNNINPYIYLQWVIDNCKLRIEQFRISESIDGSTAQICKMPRRQKDSNGERLSMYDPKYECAFDHIGYEGLDPWSYLEMKEQEKQRIKNY